MTTEKRNPFAERILQEALAERDRLLEGIRDELAAVDAIIAAASGETISVSTVAPPPAQRMVGLPIPPPQVEVPVAEPPAAKPPKTGVVPPRERADFIINHLREQGPTTRVDLSRAMGVGTGQWNRLEERLLEQGVITKRNIEGRDDLGRRSRHTLFELKSGVVADTGRKTPLAPKGLQQRDREVFEYIKKNQPVLRAEIGRVFGVEGSNFNRMEQRLIEKYGVVKDSSVPRQTKLLLATRTAEAPAPERPEKPPEEARSYQDGKPIAKRSEILSVVSGANGPISSKGVLDGVKDIAPQVVTLGNNLRDMIREGVLARVEDADGNVLRDKDKFPLVKMGTGVRPARAVVEKKAAQERRGSTAKVKPPKPPKKGRLSAAPQLDVPEHLKLMPSTSGSVSSKLSLDAGQKQYDILKELAAHGGEEIPGVLVSEMLGIHEGEEYKKALARFAKHFRQLEEAELVERTGTGFTERQREQQHKPGRTGGGRPQIKYGLTAKGREAIGVEAPDEEEEVPVPPTTGLPRPDREMLLPTQEMVRDKVTKMEGIFSPGQVADQGEEPDWPLEITTMRMEELATRGTLQDRSPAPDMRLFEYEKPSGPGAAALKDMSRPPGERGLGGGGGADLRTPGRGRAVAGTGSSLWSRLGNAEVKQLVKELEQQGIKCNIAGDGHVAVETPVGRRVLISATPKVSRSVQNDRARLRRFGCQV